MNDERSDRDRVTAILTLADDVHDPAVCQLGNEGVWAARRLLEALDTIDKARKLHFASTNIHGPDGSYCGACVEPWPCPTWLALNGGNE